LGLINGESGKLAPSSQLSGKPTNQVLMLFGVR
jgi:hypothetical protein